MTVSYNDSYDRFDNIRYIQPEPKVNRCPFKVGSMVRFPITNLFIIEVDMENVYEVLYE